MERLEALISGRVQMVMFWDFACRHARALRLMGEVENLPDGTVRVIAEGPREVLDAYALKLSKGPLLARVENVRTAYRPATGAFTMFRITY